MLSQKIKNSINEINKETDSIEEACDVLKDVCQSLGINHFYLGIFFGKESITESFFLYSNYLREWEGCYQRNRCHLCDPIFNSLKKIEFPFEWDVKGINEMILLQRELMQETYKFGIEKGTTIPLLPHSMFHGFFTIINQVSIHPDVVHMLSLAANTCTNKIMKCKEAEIFKCLTDREMDVLIQKSHGLSIKGVSRKLDVTESTMAFHLANIRKKLDVSTTEQAVLKFLNHTTLK